MAQNACSSVCSCVYCDMKNPYEKPEDVTCSCENCTVPKTCLYYNEKLCNSSERTRKAANPPTTKEWLCSGLSQLFNKIKPPTTSLATPPGVDGGTAGNVFDEPKICSNKQESSEVPKICCEKQESPDFMKGAAGYVFDVPKICSNKQESSEVPKICCENQESPDLMKGAVRCILDAPKICSDKQESSEVSKICSDKQESSEVSKIISDKQESPDLMKGAVGYVFDVPKIYNDKQESSEVPKICGDKQELSKVPKLISDKQESPDLMKGAAGYVFDVPKIYSDKQESSKVPKICFDKQESPDLMKGAAGYIVDVPKVCCDKQKSPNLMKGAAGCNLDVPKIFSDKQESSEVPKIYVEKLKSPDLMKGAAGYLFVPKTYKEPSKTGQEICIESQSCKENKIESHQNNTVKCKPECAYNIPICKDIDNAKRVCKTKKSKRCKCNKKIESEPSRHADELPQCTHQPPSHKSSSECCQGSTNIYHMQKLPNYFNGGACYVFDVPKICCEKQESPDLMIGAAGYAFDVPKIVCHKHESSEVPKICHRQESLDLMNGAAGYVFDVPKIFCDKQESPDNFNVAADFSFELPKTSKELSKTGQETDIERQCCKEKKIERHKKNTTNEYIICNPPSAETKTARLGSENSTQVFNIPLGSKRTTSDTMHICCKTKNGSDPQQPTKNAQGLIKNILQTQENALKIEKTLSDYVYELPKYSPTTQKKSCESRESAENTQKIGIHGFKGKAFDSKNQLITKKCDWNESAKFKSDKPKCGSEKEKNINSCAFTEPVNHKPKLPEFAYDVPICKEIDNAERVWKNKKSCKCKCKNSIESEPSGYVHELPKCTHKVPSQKSSSECRQRLTKIYRQELPGYFDGGACYLFDVPKTCCDNQESFEVTKICCYNQKSSKANISCHKQESSEVPNICYRQESSDLMKGAAGYIFDVPRVCCNKQESSEVPKICCHNQESSEANICWHKQESSEVKKIFYHKQESSELPKICHKQESPVLMKDAAGYVFDVPKICCDKQELPYHLNVAAGYVFELPKAYKEVSKTGQEIDIERQFCKEKKIGKHKKNTINVCNVWNPSETSSSSETKTARLGSENSTQVFNIPLGSKITTSDTMHICCKTKHGSDSQQYKPTKDAQGLFKNILQSQDNALKIEHTLSGYVHELPEYSSTTQKNTCECRESADNTRKISINRPKAKASDSKNKLINKKSSEAPGCVREVQKYSPKHYDHKIQKCDWNECAKYKSDKTGYGLEQKIQINGCAFTEILKRTPKLPECAYDVPICREIDNAERVWKNKKCCECKYKKNIESESSGNAHELPKCSHELTSQKSSSECREGLFKNILQTQENALKIEKTLSGYVCVLPKYSPLTHKKSCVCRESFKNKSTSPEYAQELTKCTHIPQSHKSNSEGAESVSTAGKIQSGLPGYVFVVPKQTEKCYACTKSANYDSKSPHDAANNAEVFSINKLESKCIRPDTQNICISMFGTQTNTIKVLESLHLPHPASKCKIDLNKDVLKNQAETIEVLKKIYLPQKSKTISTCCSLNLTELSDTMKTYKNAATQPGTANLSTEELVHMPNAEFNDCLTSKQSNMSNNTKNISQFDIIKRLKEVYKACSCKICDCFGSSKPVKIDASKSYECEKCSRSISLHEINEQPLCSCKPCDCVQCTNSLAGLCHCDPCQYGDCKRRSIHQGQRFLVAPTVTEENIQRVACTCSPCTCIECGQVYPLASTTVNEMSTSTNRHALCRCEICLYESCDQSGFDSCKCQKHKKVMSKPVEHDIHEFDIRTARIVHNTPMFQRIDRNYTIGMFAVTPGRYPIATNAIKSSQLFSSNKAKSKSDFNDRYKNYCELNMPYECPSYNKIQSQDMCCVCDTWDCLNCETSNMPKNLHRFGRHRCSDGAYERYSKKETPGRFLHPSKKGDVLTPSIHKLKVQNQILQKQHLEEPSCSIPKVTTNIDSTSKLRDVDIFQELTSEFNTSNRKIGSITQANLYMNDYLHYQERNKRRSLNKNIAIDNEISGSCFSDYSSSYYKRYGSNTLISRNKSRESSCNSSGYNNSEYFIEFQKGTAETSFKDVMKLDMDETIKLDKCNIIQNSTDKHNEDKISYNNISGNENSCKIKECNNFSNSKKARPTESNNNNSENAHIANIRLNCKNSLHGQLNNQSEKHKNCGNNVLQNRERNELQNSACLTGSRYSLEMNDENREYMNAINDFNELHVARNVYNISEGNTSRLLLPIHDKKYTSTYSDFVNGANILNIKRVRNTLMEAKKFSLELIRLLKMYEKANDEFESISEKLK